MSAELDFRNLAFRQNPHGFYEQARQEGAIIKAKGLDAYVVTRYQECEALLKDSRISLDQFTGEGFSADHPMQKYFQMREGLMLFANGRRHEELRAPAKPAFSPGLIKRYEPIVRELAREAVEKMKERFEQGEEIEFVREVSLPFVSQVICRVVGMPEQDHAFLARMTQAVADGLDPFGAEHDLQRAGQGYAEFRSYMEQQLALGRWKDTGFANSFLGDIAQCPHMLGGFGNQEDLISTTVMLLAAGHLTTNHSLSLSLQSLLDDSQLSHYVQDETAPITPQMIEELFRYHAPAQITRRKVDEPLEIGGKTFLPGQALWLALVSANRDERVFENPQELDFGRKRNPHLAFGGGAHFCLGVHLARLQLRVFLEELQGRFPELTKVNALEDRNLVFRGLKALTLRA